MKFIVSLTSIPRRFDACLRTTLLSLAGQRDCPPILVNIPAAYRKWGVPEVPAYLHALPNVIVHRLDTDYGPATKLLGALIYLRDNPGPTHVVTVDDDVCFASRIYLRYLLRCARVLPDLALTIGGIALVGPPYRCDAGLRYRNAHAFVDLTAGYRGVVYPVDPLMGAPLVFALRDRLPDGIFNDDDIYFGVILDRLGIPLYALPPPLDDRWSSSGGSGDSAVAENTLVDRRANESTLLTDAVDRGLLVPASLRPRPAIGFRRRLRLRYQRARSGLPW